MIRLCASISLTISVLSTLVSAAYGSPCGNVLQGDAEAALSRVDALLKESAEINLRSAKIVKAAAATNRIQSELKKLEATIEEIPHATVKRENARSPFGPQFPPSLNGSTVRTLQVYLESAIGEALRQEIKRGTLPNLLASWKLDGVTFVYDKAPDTTKLTNILVVRDPKPDFRNKIYNLAVVVKYVHKMPVEGLYKIGDSSFGARNDRDNIDAVFDLDFTVLNIDVMHAKFEQLGFSNIGSLVGIRGSYDLFVALKAMGYAVNLLAKDQNYLVKLEGIEAVEEFKREALRNRTDIAKMEATATDEEITLESERVRAAFVKAAAALKVLAQLGGFRIVSDDQIDPSILESMLESNIGRPKGVITQSEYERHYGGRHKTSSHPIKGSVDGVSMLREFADAASYVQNTLGYDYDVKTETWSKRK